VPGPHRAQGICQRVSWKAGCMKELGLNIDLEANLEIQSRDLSGIGRHLVLALSFGNVQPKVLVQLIKVSDKTLGVC